MGRHGVGVAFGLCVGDGHGTTVEDVGWHGVGVPCGDGPQFGMLGKHGGLGFGVGAGVHTLPTGHGVGVPASATSDVGAACVCAIAIYMLAKHMMTSADNDLLTRNSLLLEAREKCSGIWSYNSETPR